MDKHGKMEFNSYKEQFSKKQNNKSFPLRRNCLELEFLVGSYNLHPQTSLLLAFPLIYSTEAIKASEWPTFHLLLSQVPAPPSGFIQMPFPQQTPPLPIYKNWTGPATPYLLSSIFLLSTYNNTLYTLLFLVIVLIRI